MSFILRMTLRASLAAFLLLVPLGRLHAEDPPPPRKVTTVEGITEYKLDNGARVLLYPDKSSPTVTVNMVVLVGSRHEGYGEAGMAHLLEHLTFKGTPTHPDILKALRDHGITFGHHSNGQTTPDRTAYWETMKASDENLEFAIRLEADRLVNSYIKREDLLSEMTVVRNEFEMSENSPKGVLSERMLGAAYHWHNYAKSTIGNKSDIERVSIEHLEAFYKKYYQPDNIVVIVAGNFEEEKALGHVTKYFGALKRPERRLEETYTEEPAQDGERQVMLRRVGKVGASAVMYHIPAMAHPDSAALSVLANILAAAPNGRLYKALEEKKKASNTGCEVAAMHDPGVISFSVDVDREKSPEEVRDLMVELLEGLHKTKLTDEEVDRAKRVLAASYVAALRDTNVVGVALKDWVGFGDWRLFFLHRDRIEKVTAEDVTRVCEKYLKRSNRTTGIYVPTDEAERTAIPESPAIAEILKDYKGRESTGGGEAFDTSPQNIEKRVKRSELPSGVKLALLPKQNRGETVTLELALQYGNLESLKGNTAAAQMLGHMMIYGTKSHTRQQILDELTKLEAGFLINTTAPGGVGVLIQSKRDRLPAVLKVVTEILREPSFPRDEFEILKEQRIKDLEAGLSEPDQLAITAFLRKLQTVAADDVRYVPAGKESLAQMRELKLEDIVKLYEQIGGQHGQIALVGDFDEEETVKALADMLKDWKPAVKYQRIPSSDKKSEGSREIILTPDKANAIYVAGLGIALRDDDPDFPALRLANFLFGEAFLASRLSVRVRGKDGLSYGTYSSLSVATQDRVGTFRICAICNPANIDKVDRAIAEELEKVCKDGFTDKEVEEGKMALLESWKSRSDADLADMLVELQCLGRTFDWIADYEKKLGELKSAEVSAAFRKYIDPKKLAIIHAGDFPKEAPKSK